MSHTRITKREAKTVCLTPPATDLPLRTDGLEVAAASWSASTQVFSCVAEGAVRGCEQSLDSAAGGLPAPIF